MTHTSDKHFTDEELELVARGKEDGMYMKAPNGSPTSLNEKQWAQVRTGTFKSWFGNWENAPEAASRIVDDIRFRQVYHGSPASFGHFDHAFTGTGEGAQAYGWGTYVTEVKGIARKYAAIGIKRGNHITYDGELLSPVLDNEYYFDEVWRIWKRQILSSTDVDSLKRNISSVYMDGRTASTYSGRRKAFERQQQELLSDIDAGRIRIEPPRHLYTVEIPEDNGMNYLYWDRPVSAEQQGKIFLQLRKERFFFPEATAEFWSGRSHVWNSGKEFYGFLDYMFMNPDRDTDSQRLASGFLSRAGFTGIDYPAECSTGGRADGARNYVIFSEADLKITAHERFRFIGEKGASRLDRSEGASLRLENLAVAREMEKSGKDAGTIKAATGWERGADSKWRYETADFEYHPAGDLGYSRLLEKQSWHGELENLLDRQIEGETLSEAEWKRFEELTELAAGLKEQDELRERIYLDDYVKDDELFQAYPEMKRTRLEFVDLPSADYCGGYLHPDNRIVINISRTDDVRSVLAHEIQHAIQTMEGFARGSNPGEFKNTVENVILDIVRATDGRILEGGGFDNTPKGIFAALDRKVPYGTILRHYDYPLSLVAEKYGKYSINSLVYWVTYVHNVVYSFYRSMIYCYINSTQRCAGSIVIDIIPTNGADKRKFFPFAPYFPVTNVIKRYFYPYFPAIIGIKGYSFPYFPYLSGIMKIKTALYSLFSRLDWHKTVVFPCLGEIYEGIRSLSWEIPVT